MQPIAPMLWFDSQAEEAADFYVSVFPDSKITSVQRYGEAGPGPAGTAMVVAFTLRGQEFSALNGGPIYQFTPAISFVVDCITQDDVDHYWDGLLAGGGEPVQCGWLTDRFGVSWQVVPRRLAELIGDPDPEKAKRVTAAMLKMIKLDIAGLEAAYAGE
jgi:predicted 3-demethylubiquinone-9 3-methyltransferase (glyoxalase superfamily)